MRFPTLLAAFGLLAAPALAQTTPAPNPGAPPSGPSTTSYPAPPSGAPAAPASSAAPHHGRQSMQEHFDAANTTHDGHLTREQAQAGYKTIARNFDKIDVDKKGYVTMDDYQKYRSARSAARKAAREKKQG